MQPPRKVLVMELAGLGDNVHLLPALWKVRSHWPQAQLHVMVNAPAAPLFALTPWVDRTWGYPSPKPGLAGSLRWVRALRAEGFDCAINTTGSDRSSLLCLVCGAPVRIGRYPADGGPPGWKWLFTRAIRVPHYEEPMHVQKRRFVHAALGLAREGADEPPDFHVTIDPALRRRAGIEAADEGRYIHVSPFTTADERELPRRQVTELLAGLRERFPSFPLVLSCARNSRESRRMRDLLASLAEPPWKVFDGSLDVAGLAAVIEKSALSFSGDTGGLHLAAMTDARAVAWFRAHRGQDEWIPRSPRYRVVVAEGGARDALHGIATPALLDAAAELLSREAP